MKKAFPIAFLPDFYTGVSCTFEVASFNLPQEVEAGIGPCAVGRHFFLQYCPFA